MTYPNPLHPPVPDVRVSSYSTLSDTVQPGSSVSRACQPLPFIPYTPRCKFREAMGRSQPRHPAIAFDFYGQSRRGVPMQELSSRNAQALARVIRGADDQVLVQTGLTRIVFRILWPGYEHLDWTRSIEVNTKAPITRVQLGVVVAMNYARFIERSRTNPPKTREWRVGSSGIRFEHLILLSLRNVFEDIWQAEIAVNFY